MARFPKWKVAARYFSRSARDPESLARGVGLGLFVGFLPSIGFQVFMAFFLAGVLNANRIIAVFGTFVSNPFTAIPLSAASIWFGDFLLPGEVFGNFQTSNFNLSELFSSPGQIGLAYLVGCLAFSTLAGASGYAVTRLYCVRSKKSA